MTTYRSFELTSGEIDINELDGGFDLQKTLESGQTFLWNRTDDKYFSEEPLPEDEWYYTTTDKQIIKVRQNGDTLEWEANVPEFKIWERLRLNDDLEDIKKPIDDELADEAFEQVSGLRIPNDPVVPCLVSFICSSNMRVERIHNMQWELADRFGDTIIVDNREYQVYPTAQQLANATEEELKEAKLGYRASWVKSTAENLADNEHDFDEVSLMDYKEARDYLKQFTGVGDKVADCTLLYSLDHLEAVPIDTWVQSAVDDYYPDCSGGYDEVADCLRDIWGMYAGYTQAYVFEYLRRNENYE